MCSQRDNQVDQVVILAVWLVAAAVVVAVSFAVDAAALHDTDAAIAPKALAAEAISCLDSVANIVTFAIVEGLNKMRAAFVVHKAKWHRLPS